VQHLSIGSFSRLTHLSIKTLRYYHEVGLLEPAVVDAGSGYRYYLPGQVHSAHLVRRFRDLGLPVADVKAILTTPDPSARDAILAGHLDRMRDQLRQTEAAVDSLRRMLEGGPPVSIEERVLKGGPAISIATDVTRTEVAAWWWKAFAELRTIADGSGAGAIPHRSARLPGQRPVADRGLLAPGSGRPWMLAPPLVPSGRSRTSGGLVVQAEDTVGQQGVGIVADRGDETVADGEDPAVVVGVMLAAVGGGGLGLQGDGGVPVGDDPGDGPPDRSGVEPVVGRTAR
jgi:DNA-binding transcriptional MerR regulator